MKKSFNKIKKWWNNKDYKGKRKSVLNLTMFLWAGSIIAFFISPFLYLGVMLTILLTNGYVGHLSTKNNKIEEQKIEEKLNALNKKETEERIKKHQEQSRESLPEETREALDALFNNDKKTDETNNDSYEENFVSSEPHMEPKFKDLFNSK